MLQRPPLTATSISTDMRKIIALALMILAPSALADDMPLLGVSQGQSTGLVPPPAPTAQTCSLSLQLLLCVGGSN